MGTESSGTSTPPPVAVSLPGANDWESMVNQVVIAGRPSDVESASLGWQALLQNLGSVRDNLKKNVTDLKDYHVWSGPAYDAYAKHINKIADKVDQVIKDANDKLGIVQALHKAAQDLATKQAEMPIPASSLPAVLAARHAHAKIGIGSFKIDVENWMLSNPLAKIEAWVIDNWINDQSDAARQVYNDLGRDTGHTNNQTPGQTTAGNQTFNTTTQHPDLTGGGGGGGGGGVPKLGSPPGTGKIPNTGNIQHPTTPGIDEPPSHLPQTHVPNTNSNLPNSHLPGTGGGRLPSGGGLAGGSGGLGTAGLGTGGLGGGGVGGLGAGTGAGGGIPGGGALGKSVSPPIGAVPLGGAGAGRGAGGKSAGRGTGGLLGTGGQGRGQGTGSDERSSWLQEDEDVWGEDTNAAPPVLGAGD